MNSQLDNFDLICRICLQMENLRPIFQESSQSLSKKIRICGLPDIASCDGLPKNICDMCVRILEAAYLFKTVSHKSDRLLKEMLHRKKAPGEQGADVNVSLPEAGQNDINVKTGHTSDSPPQHQTNLYHIKSQPAGTCTESIGIGDRQDDDKLNMENETVSPETNGSRRSKTIKIEGADICQEALQFSDEPGEEMASYVCSCRGRFMSSQLLLLHKRAGRCEKLMRRRQRRYDRVSFVINTTIKEEIVINSDEENTQDPIPNHTEQMKEVGNDTTDNRGPAMAGGDMSPGDRVTIHSIHPSGELHNHVSNSPLSILPETHQACFDINTAIPDSQTPGNETTDSLPNISTALISPLKTKHRKTLLNLMSERFNNADSTSANLNTEGIHGELDTLIQNCAETGELWQGGHLDYSITIKEENLSDSYEAHYDDKSKVFTDILDIHIEPPSQQVHTASTSSNDGLLLSPRSDLRVLLTRLDPSILSPKRSKNYQCQLCPFTSQFSSWLKRHINSVHRKSKKLPTNSDSAAKYCCQLCSYTTMRRSCLETHAQGHRKHTVAQIASPKRFADEYAKRLPFRPHPFLPFTCNICDYATKNASHLKRHWLRHDRVKPSNLIYTDKMLKSNRQKKMTNPKKTFTCTLCDCTASSELALGVHMTCHHQTAPVSASAPLSASAVAALSLLNQHVPAEPDTPEPTLHVSDYSSIAKAAPYTNKKYTCSICHYTCNLRRNYVRHVFSHKNGVRHPARCTKEALAHSCDICNFKCRELPTLVRHLKSHLVAGKLTKLLQEKFGFLTSRTNPERDINSKEVDSKQHQSGDTTQISCNQCSFSSSNLELLKQHITNNHSITSTTSDRVPCGQCYYSTNNKKELTLHMQQCHEALGSDTQGATSRSEDQPVRAQKRDRYQCEDCSYSTNRNHTMAKHRSCHTMNKKFSCTMCSYSSDKLMFLKRHKKIEKH